MAKLEFDEALVRRLSELLDETGLTEIEYEADGRRIRVARNSGVAAAQPAAADSAATLAPVPAESPPGDQDIPANAVKAPMVGTVYTAAEPGASAFVTLGDQVEQGQTLVIIEAMKVMNPIPSPRAGTVSQIMVQDGQPVEYDEPLMVID
jgi:acetyl-CoA carboxylase biotin carboxyl carrier protein